jgi:hypothetical protein
MSPSLKCKDKEVIGTGAGNMGYGIGSRDYGL